MSNPRSLAIYGAGGLGRELKAWMAGLAAFRFIGFFDDGAAEDSVVAGSRVLGGEASVARYAADGLSVVVAVGDPHSKHDVCRRLSAYPGIVFPVMVHPRAILEDEASIHLGEGTVIAAGCVLTTDIVIGAHALLNLNCTVGHDTRIDRFASLMPGVHVSGNVTIGEQVLVGSGSVLLNHVSIGARSKVGAGSVVLKEVPPDCTVVGVPAKIISCA